MNTDAGTVTLTGTVDSYEERRLCAYVAKGVTVVRAVNNKVKVDYKSTRPDSEIKPEIEALLKADVRIDDYGIKVAVEDGWPLNVG